MALGNDDTAVATKKGLLIKKRPSTITYCAEFLRELAVTFKTPQLSRTVS